MKTKSKLLTGLSKKAYLDSLVKKTTHLYYLSDFENIRLCDNDMCIQLFSGIEDLAAVAGKEICVTKRDDPTFPAKLSFKYKGIEFFQLLNATLIQHSQGD